jgi:ABC-type nitrate/sulfonate/bicarbonate transport system permease component
VRNLSLQIFGILLIPILWVLAADILQISSPVLLPPLKNVCSRLVALFASGEVLNDISATMIRWGYGFSFGIIAGVFVGLLLGLSSTLRRVFEFPLEFIRSMPVTAIFPLFLIVFGIGDPSKVAMAFTPTFLLMVVNTSYGVTLVDPTRRKMAAVFGANRSQIFYKILIMDALPQIFVGLRLALAQSLIVTIVSEMFIGTDFGLGQRVYDSYLTNSVSTLYALLIVLGIIGYVANKILVSLESRFIYWTGK